MTTTQVVEMLLDVIIFLSLDLKLHNWLFKYENSYQTESSHEIIANNNQKILDIMSLSLQVDESKKHGADEIEFSREDEIMCSVLENIS